MKVQVLVAAAAIALEGASALPGISHAHLHKLHLRDVMSKRANFDDPSTYKDVDWDCVFHRNGKKAGCDPHGKTSEQPQEGQTSPAETSTGDVPKASSDKPATVQKNEKSSTKSEKSSGNSASSGSGKCVDTKALDKRATLQQDGHVGNIAGNIKGESDCKSSGKYSITFVNNRGSKKTFWLWNKATETAPQDGMMKDPAKTFDLEDGAKATYTFEGNSHVGFSEACGRASDTNGNVPNCNVGEANFNDQNFEGGAKGGSFYDVSMVTVTDIKAKGGSPSTIPMKLSAPGFSDSTTEQCNYVKGSDNSSQNPPSGGSCHCGPDGPDDFHVTATFG